MPHRHDDDLRLRTFAREMRRKPTDAERKLWWKLRDRRLGGFKFRRQTPTGGFIADFVCEEASVIVELDGDQHSEDEAKRYDQSRTTALEGKRYRVLRFSSRLAVKETEVVAKTILRFMTEGR